MRGGTKASGGGRRRLAHVLVLGVVLGVLLPFVVAGPAAAAGDDATPPLGTVLQGGRWTVDTAGRVLLLHGVTLPATEVPDAAAAAKISAAGFDAVSLPVTFSNEGLVVDVPGANLAIGGHDAPIDTLAAAVTTLYDHGIVTMLALVPEGGGVPRQDHLAAALDNVSQRFVQVPGVAGIEIRPPVDEDVRLDNGAVRRVDPFHLLWRVGPAPFATGATLAANGAAGLLTGWAGGAAATVSQLVSTVDTQQIGWIYDQPNPGNNVDALVRPYAAAIAGTPTAYSYDPDSRVFALQYDVSRAGGGVLPAAATTEVTVPASRYPEGYEVQVTGGKVVSRAGAGDVCVRVNPGGTRVAIRVAPAALGQGDAVRPSLGLAGCPSGAVAPADKGNVGVTGVNAPVESVGPGGVHKTNETLKWALPIGGAAAMLVLISGILYWRRGRSRRQAASQPEDTSPYL